jgi:isoleucyl-tRNA synthetase
VYSGIFATYANFGWTPSDRDPLPSQRPLIDRWMLSRLASVEAQVDALLERYEATHAVNALMDFFVNDVSNWYVRLNRARFYDVDGDDNRAAFATLHEVLTVTCRLLAPFAPFVTDWVHTELTGESVHVAPYVRAEPDRIDADLEAAMADMRALATLGRAAREDAGIKVRQPLGRMVAVVPSGSANETHEALVALLAAELNVKTVSFATSADAFVTLEAKPNFRTLGKKFGKDTPVAAAQVAALDSAALLAFERGEPLVIATSSVSRALEPDDVSIVRRASGDLVVKAENGYVAAIDPEISDALRGEGIARELVNRVQRLRKELDYAVSDRIALGVTGDPAVLDAVMAHADWIANEVLATQLDTLPMLDPSHAIHRLDLDGLAADVTLTRTQT